MSSNTNLNEIIASGNSNLIEIDLRNGNNTSMNNFSVNNCPALNCILVDSVSIFSITVSCIFQSFTTVCGQIFGCTNPIACNFNSLANVDDGSCYGLVGCTDPSAINYNPLATCNQNLCSYPKTFVPDNNFESFLENRGYGDGIPFNDSVFTSNISSLQSLYINAQSISDLTGIQDFISLEFINCKHNH